MAEPDLADAFPLLDSLEPDGAARLRAAAQRVWLETGALVFEPGQACRQYLLIEGGCVRVHLLDADGHEIVLYRLGRGETCILTTAALLGAETYAAYAVTEQPTVAIAVPAMLFDTLVAQSAAFRRFVFASHSRRIAALMRVVSDVAFTRVRIRLARCLLRSADAAGVVALTHEAMAVELGTAREVVSRNLKTMDGAGLLRLGHGTVALLDRGGLAAIAEGGHR